MGNRVMGDAAGSAVDIFLSYAREDRGFAKDLAGQLEAEGFRVWWDFELIGGQDYRSEIAEAIGRSEHVIVLWSQTSVTSHFVIDEASLAMRQGKLVPVLMEDVPPPLGFGGLHTVTCRDPRTDAAAVIAALRFRPAPSDPGAKPVQRRAVLGGLAGVSVAVGVAAYGEWDWLRSRLDGAAGSGRAGFSAPVQRLALVVGNNQYQRVARLENAVNDATAMGRALAGAGFNVALLPDSGTDDFREAIRQFKILLSVGGVGVFYYAGHAAHIAGRDFVLPVDAPDVRSAEEFVKHAVEITEVRSPIKTFFSGLQPKVRYAGLQFITKNPDGTTQPADISDWKADPQIKEDRPALPGRSREDHGVMTVYSADRGEVAHDGEGRHSPFAQALLSEIGTGDGDVVRIARRVRQKVRDLTGRKQTPVLEDETTREFYFNRPDRDPRDGVLRLVFLDSCRDNPFATKPGLLRP